MAAVNTMSLDETRGFMWPTLSLDDQLWVQAMVSTRFLHADRRTRESNFEERSLYGLMTLGLTDRTEADRPFPSSTRSMRFASCLGDHLWALIEQERARVSSQRYFGGPKLTDYFREIAWKERFVDSKRRWTRSKRTC
jgi:hypothetical protein